MNHEQARFNMIEQQIRPANVLDKGSLDLLLAIPRETFVPPAYCDMAFADCEIPLGRGATMLMPLIEARVLQAVQVKKHEKVLEVGTGSGYMAALLAAQAEQVWSIEIEPVLAETARVNLGRAGIGNVSVETGDGLKGLPGHSPYDVIVISGALPEVPAALLAQLKIKGRLFAIVGEAPTMAAQLVTRIDEHNYSARTLFETCTAGLRNAAGHRTFVF
ncbi:MAG: protein-L-isoaspartate O-methyltransferase [Rhodocyclaceae bacterium]|jgi:protein-L-isoaspartate(D-aspartate) O-methyltransferase|nr:protein-L-isoaspartate O-methyltransferase [Rhodocyclaceae bacterium]